MKVLGIALTAVAASLGAPFWFDTLNKIVSIRSAGKAPEEQPKPPKKVPRPREPEDTPGQTPAQLQINVQPAHAPAPPPGH